MPQTRMHRSQRQLLNPTRPLPGQAIPDAASIRAELVAQQAQEQGIALDTKEVRLALEFLEKAEANTAMANYLRDIATKGLIRAGPYAGFLATHRTYVDPQAEEALYLMGTTNHPAHYTAHGRAASLVWEIGATARFNCSLEENEARMQRFETWLNKLESGRVHNPGLFKYLDKIDRVVDGIEEGFDYIVLVPIAKDEETEQDQRFKKDIVKDVVGSKTEILFSGPDLTWQGKAGNGMGTLMIMDDINKRFIARGSSIRKELEQGKSMAIVHLAGDASRVAISRTRNNKCLLEVTPTMNIGESAVKSIQPMVLPGKILVVFGDQAVLGSREDFDLALKRANDKYKTILFGIDYPSVTHEDVRRFGWQLVDGDELLAFDDTRDYFAVQRKMQSLGRVEVGLRWNMGSFAVDADVAEWFLEAFRPELEAKRGMFNSDEGWQAWMAKDRTSYINECGKGDPKKEAQAAYVYDKVDPIKQKILARFDRSRLIGSLSLGNKDQAVNYDFGTDTTYRNTVMLLIDEGLEGRTLRQYTRIDKYEGMRGDLTLVDSVYHASHVKQGIICDSVVMSTRGELFGIQGALVSQSFLNVLKAASYAMVFNVVDHTTLQVASDWLMFDVFHPVEGRLRFQFRIGDQSDMATKKKEEWWEKPINSNPLSLKQLQALMSGVTNEQRAAVKAKMTALAGYIIENGGSAEGIISAVELSTEDFVMLRNMAKRNDPLAIACLENIVNETTITTRVEKLVVQCQVFFAAGVRVNEITADLLRFAFSDNVEARWHARYILGRLINLNIQDMLDRTNKAGEVVDFFRTQAIPEQQSIIRGIIRSCLKESSLSNIFKAADWVARELNIHQDPTRPLPGQEMPPVEVIREELDTHQAAEQGIPASSKEVQLALEFLSKVEGNTEMTQYLREIADKGLIRAGPYA
ncbi:MAG: hypothetical protein ABSE81_07615, partial [Candidatus Omnitrophota bacterium]